MYDKSTNQIEGHLNGPLFQNALQTIEEAAKLIMDLRENHRVFVSVVTYPVVERGELMLRIIPTATHSREDVELTLNAFEAIRDNMQKGVYSGKVASGS